MAVPDGAETGGDFQLFPPCREPGDFGCIVSYVSYRATDPPMPGDFFGNAGDGFEAICTNPVPLGRGGRVTKPYFPTQPSTLLMTGGPVQGPFADPERVSEITTPFYTMPDFIEVACETTPGYEFLSVRILGDPADPRADDISGALESLLPGWGLHIIDVSLAMGDIVELVRLQATNYAGG
jgi:hypothetical protein